MSILDPSFDPLDKLISCQLKVVELEDLVHQLIYSNNEQAKLLEEMSKSFNQVSQLVLQNDKRLTNVMIRQSEQISPGKE